MLRKDDPNIAEAQAQAKQIFESRDLGAIGELLSGVIDGPNEDYIDVWAEALGEVDMVDTDRYEVETPEHVWGGKALKYEYGMTIPVAKVTKGKLSVAPEYITTPAYEFDINDLAAGDVVDVARINELARTALLREKNIRGLRLFTSGVTTFAAGLRTVLKSENPASDLTAAGDKWKWQVTLKQTLDRAVKELQDTTNGGPVSMILRTITLGDVEACGFNTAQVRVLQLNAAVDPDTNTPMFEEGDILLLGRGVGVLGRVLATQPAMESNFWTVRYAFRQGHVWVRWQDSGYNAGRIRRIYLVPDADYAGAATVTVERFAKDGFILRSDRALDASTITTANVIISATEGGALADGVSYSAVTADGTMRRIVIDVAGLAAASAYYVRWTTGTKDLGAQAVTAGAFGPVTVN